jgi:hypothetical protein
MSPDPRQIIRDLGVDPAVVRSVDVLSGRHGHMIWRIVTPQHSYILKWQPETDASVEVEGYLLLQKLGVPSLPLYGSTTHALLLEDLARSDAWRPAVQADSARAEVGRAVARWYRVLHDAGEALLSDGDCPTFLTRETDELEPHGILATGRALGVAGCPVWRLASEHIGLLKAAVGRLSVTLNYNDFYWTNLALSRREDARLEAIVFDYHLLGVGMRYSDCRNVAGSLSGAAVGAFWDTYGSVDPREAKLDQPLAALHALHVASHMPRFPTWAEDSLASVMSGDLEKRLVTAIELARSLCEPTP